MRPYYEDNLVALFHGDALEVTEWLTADVLLTDPPYGIAWKLGQAFKESKGDMRHAGIANDHSTAARDSALALWGTRPALVFGSLDAAYPPGWRRMLVFQKPAISGVTGSRLPWRRDWEPIFALGEWPDQVPRSSAVLRTSETSAGGYSGYATKAGHAHAKPVDVLARLIEACPPGVIADPFAGSASALVAARLLGRRAIGVEIDERYCEGAARRLAQQPMDFGEWEA